MPLVLLALAPTPGLDQHAHTHTSTTFVVNLRHLAPNVTVLLCLDLSSHLVPENFQLESLLYTVILLKA